MLLDEFFASERIEFYSELSANELRITDRRRFEQMSAQIGAPESAVVFLIPYFAGLRSTNLSAYAMPRDYHLYVRLLSERLRAYCAEKNAGFSVAGFSDTSPIDEREAALKAGLGVSGKNGLILNEKYGSYHFIGEFFITAAQNPKKALSPRFCKDCGACRASCPTGAIRDPQRKLCLSLLTQKKVLTEEEKALVEKAVCKWGCDICQEVCPYNQSAAITPIPFFTENLILRLSPENAFADEKQFAERAFSWRGRGVLRRNLSLCEQSADTENE